MDMDKKANEQPACNTSYSPTTSQCLVSGSTKTWSNERGDSNMLERGQVPNLKNQNLKVTLSGNTSSSSQPYTLEAPLECIASLQNPNTKKNVVAMLEVNNSPFGADSTGRTKYGKLSSSITAVHSKFSVPTLLSGSTSTSSQPTTIEAPSMECTDLIEVNTKKKQKISDEPSRDFTGSYMLRNIKSSQVVTLKWPHKQLTLIEEGPSTSHVTTLGNSNRLEEFPSLHVTGPNANIDSSGSQNVNSMKACMRDVAVKQIDKLTENSHSTQEYNGENQHITNILSNSGCQVKPLAKIKVSGVHSSTIRGICNISPSLSYVTEGTRQPLRNSTDTLSNQIQLEKENIQLQQLRRKVSVTHNNIIPLLSRKAVAKSPPVVSATPPHCIANRSKQSMSRSILISTASRNKDDRINIRNVNECEFNQTPERITRSKISVSCGRIAPMLMQNGSPWPCEERDSIQASMLHLSSVEVTKSASTSQPTSHSDPRSLNLTTTTKKMKTSVGISPSPNQHTTPQKAVSYNNKLQQQPSTSHAGNITEIEPIGESSLQDSELEPVVQGSVQVTELEPVVGSSIQKPSKTKPSVEQPPMSKYHGTSSGAKGGNMKSSRKTAKSKKHTSESNLPLEVEDEDDCSLFSLIVRDSQPLQSLVDDWVESYKRDQRAALVVLLQLFIDTSGCKSKMTVEMLSKMQNQDVLSTMNNDFDHNTIMRDGYPLMRKSTKWKKFIVRFETFINVLVKKCQNSILYDQFLLDNVSVLLYGMSRSQMEPFRHTAILAAMKLTTALVEVMVTVLSATNHVNRQIAVENEKLHDSERLQILLAKRQELKENFEELEDVFTYYFKSLFVLRVWDVVQDIRNICIVELGAWMQKFGEKFVEDTYLKYLGWSLNDPIGDVRFSCLKVLQPLYAKESLKEKLLTFTVRFKDRIISMTLDKVTKVSVLAIDIIINITKHYENILNSSNMQHMYELVFSKYQNVAQAAGCFMNSVLDSLQHEQTPQKRRSKTGKEFLPNTNRLHHIIEFFVEADLPKHDAYLVDALIDSVDALKDWGCMTDMLLEDPVERDQVLTGEEETALIKIMTSCIRQAGTGQHPIGRIFINKALSTKELKKVHQEKTCFTEHFMQLLPQLLQKYRTDPEKLVYLIVIPQYCDLNLYMTPRRERFLISLLEKIQDLVKIHYSREVLESCAKTLQILCDPKSSLFSLCRVFYTKIVDIIVSMYKNAAQTYENFKEQGVDPVEDVICDLENSILKIVIFYECNNLGQWNIWESLLGHIVEARGEKHVLSQEIIKHSIRGCFLSLVWDLHTVRELCRQDEENSNARESVQMLEANLTQYCSNISDLLSSPVQLYKDEAYITLCDLLIIFNKSNTDTALLATLQLQPSHGMKLSLADFLDLNVFVRSRDEKLLQKRRRFLASFVQLLMLDVMPMNAAIDVILQYNKYYSVYGDIITPLLVKMLEQKPIHYANIVMVILKAAFMQLLQNGPVVSRQHILYKNLQELARRIAITFGRDTTKNQKAIAKLHQQGINFSLISQEQTAFFEILVNFIDVILPQEKRAILKYLDQQINASKINSNGQTSSLQVYRNALVHASKQGSVATTKKKRPLKEKARTESENEGEASEMTTSRQNTSRRRTNKTSTKKARLDVKVIRHPRGQPRPAPSLQCSSTPSIEERCSNVISSTSVNAEFPVKENSSHASKEHT